MSAPNVVTFKSGRGEKMGCSVENVDLNIVLSTVTRMLPESARHSRDPPEI